jgi:tRNA-Thr(GGU) m(6)t(6)A37 methyltransferase TsaA
MEIVMREIGILHTPFKDKREAPIQSARSGMPGTAEVYPQYLEGLEGIEEFSHIYLLYGFHRADQELALKVKPFLDDRLRGLFTTRYPVRPNPLGLSIVRVERREGGLVHFLGADMLDGTPLLDIKPYIPEFDVFQVERTGWYGKRRIE